MLKNNSSTMGAPMFQKSSSPYKSNRVRSFSAKYGNKIKNGQLSTKRKRFKNSKIGLSNNFDTITKPAELFRADLISAMKIPDSDFYQRYEYLLINDPWRSEWDKGVQVPVASPELLSRLPKNLHISTENILHNAKYLAKHSLDKKDIKENIFEKYYQPFNMRSFRKINVLPLIEGGYCQYNMDFTDIIWMKILNHINYPNNNFTKLGRLKDATHVSMLTPSHINLFELYVEHFEKVCFHNFKQMFFQDKNFALEYDENVICDICRSPDSEDGNEMVFCDDCNICVHQACYGILTIPQGSWLCSPCTYLRQARSSFSGQRTQNGKTIITPKCCLCPNPGGALKPAQLNSSTVTTNRSSAASAASQFESSPTHPRWCHVSCALWIPEIGIGDPDRMEPLTGVSRIPSVRWNLRCAVCRGRRNGACIQCSARGCRIAFHVTCGFRGNLDMRADWTVSENNNALKNQNNINNDNMQSISSPSSNANIVPSGVKLKAFCPKHSRVKRIIKNGELVSPNQQPPSNLQKLDNNVYKRSSPQSLSPQKGIYNCINMDSPLCQPTINNKNIGIGNKNMCDKHILSPIYINSANNESVKKSGHYTNYKHHSPTSTSLAKASSDDMLYEQSRLLKLRDMEKHFYQYVDLKPLLTHTDNDKVLFQHEKQLINLTFAYWILKRKDRFNGPLIPFLVPLTKSPPTAFMANVMREKGGCFKHANSHQQQQYQNALHPVSTLNCTDLEKAYFLTFLSNNPNFEQDLLIPPQNVEFDLQNSYSQASLAHSLYTISCLDPITSSTLFVPDNVSEVTPFATLLYPPSFSIMNHHRKNDYVITSNIFNNNNNNGMPLTNMTHLGPGRTPITSTGMGNALESSCQLYHRLKMCVQLRQDLERVRNLTYMLIRREKLGSSYVSSRQSVWLKQASMLNATSVPNYTDTKQYICTHYRDDSLFDAIISGLPWKLTLPPCGMNNTSGDAKKTTLNDKNEALQHTPQSMSNSLTNDRETSHPKRYKRKLLTPPAKKIKLINDNLEVLNHDPKSINIHSIKGKRNNGQIVPHQK